MWNGTDLGPKSLWVMIPILGINILVLSLFYKELKLTSFDSGLAASLGFFPTLINYILMTSVSITAVGAFDAVGSILVVALMITPPATALLLSQRVSTMVILSVVFGVVSSVLGYGVALFLDVSIAGMMATMTGIIFILVLFFSRQQGLVVKYLNAKQQRIKFAAKMLVVQLLYHEGTENEVRENSFQNLITHMDWKERFAKSVTRYALQERYIQRDKDLLILTPLGREVARSALTMS
jgi:manganese/zinc/iron transport system permease protein